MDRAERRDRGARSASVLPHAPRERREKRERTSGDEPQRVDVGEPTDNLAHHQFCRCAFNEEEIGLSHSGPPRDP